MRKTINSKHFRGRLLASSAVAVIMGASLVPTVFAATSDAVNGMYTDSSDSTAAGSGTDYFNAPTYYSLSAAIPAGSNVTFAPTFVGLSAGETVTYSLYDSSGALIASQNIPDSSGKTATFTNVSSAVYQVAVSASSYSTSGASVSYSVPVSSPSSPSGLTATSVTSTGATLSWSAVSSATSYTILDGSGITVASGVTGTSYNVTGLSASTNYTYQVEAVNSAGTSTASSVSFTTTASGGGAGANGTSTSQASILGAPLSITAPTLSSDFGTFTLNGQVETKSATLSNWDVVDPTGTQNGWNVTLQASQLTEIAPSGGFASGTSAMTLPQGSLTLSGTRTITAASGATPVDPTNGPLLENQTSAIDTGTPVQMIDTQAGYGSGKYTINEPSNGLTLTVSPQSAKVDTVNYPSAPTPFQTTLTYSIVSGP